MVIERENTWNFIPVLQEDGYSTEFLQYILRQISVFPMFCVVTTEINAEILRDFGQLDSKCDNFCSHSCIYFVGFSFFRRVDNWENSCKAL